MELRIAEDFRAAPATIILVETLQTGRGAWRYAAVSVAAALFLFPIVRVYQATLDEGTYLDGAVRILHGALPYRDFVEPAGPGSFYWIALWFSIFGASFTVARLLLLLTGVVLVTLTFALARRLGGTGYLAAGFVLVTSIPMMLMNSPHYDSNVLVLFAVLAFLNRRSVIAGVCLGLADLCMQGKGLYIVAALGVWLFWQGQRKQVLKLIAAWSTPLLCAAAWFISQHALGDALYSTVLWPLRGYSGANTAPYAFPIGDYLHHWWSLFIGRGPVVAVLMVALWSVPFFFVAALPVIAPGMALLTRSWQSARLPVWLAGFALFASEMHRHDLEHLLNATLLLSILFVTLCETTSLKWPKLATALLALSVFLYGGIEVFNAVSQKGSSQGRRGTLAGTDGSAVLTFLQSHTKPGEPVLVYPYRPVFYFWADLKNASRYTLLMYGYNTDDQFREVVRELDRQHVRYVLWDENFGPQNARTVFPSYRPPESSRLILELYLCSTYRKVATVGGFSVMQRIAE